MRFKRHLLVALSVLTMPMLCAQWPSALAQSASSQSARPRLELQCQSFGKGPMLECLIDLANRDGTPLDGAQIMLSALMPSMPMAHTIKPVKAAATGKPGQYKGTLELEMLGAWAVDVDISGPVRDKRSRTLMVSDCEGKPRCPASPAQATDRAPTPTGAGHRH